METLERKWETCLVEPEEMKRFLKTVRGKGRVVEHDKSAGTIQIFLDGECIYRAMRSPTHWIVRAVVTQ